jgi:hypothetical protein
VHSRYVYPGPMWTYFGLWVQDRTNAEYRWTPQLDELLRVFALIADGRDPKLEEVVLVSSFLFRDGYLCLP